MERDYRVTYRSRDAENRDDDRNDPRSRIPTALDPYRYPEDRAELKRNVAEVKARNARRRGDDDYQDYDAPPSRRDTFRDDVSISTVRDGARAGTTKTTYAVTDAGLEKESEITKGLPGGSRGEVERGPVLPPAPSVPSGRGSGGYRRDDVYVEPARSAGVEVDRAAAASAPSRGGYRRDDVYIEPARSAARVPGRPYDDRDYGRTDRGYDIERPRMEGGAYVVDMRKPEIMDVDDRYGGPDRRGSDRGFAGYRNDPGVDDHRPAYSRGPAPRDPGYRRSEVVYSPRDNARSSAPSIHDEAYMSGARAPTAVPSRSQANFRDTPPSRAPTRIIDDERASTTAIQAPSRNARHRDEEEWGIIERTTTRERAAPPRDSYHYEEPPPSATPRGRARGSTFTSSASENDYVMVSPQREAAIATPSMGGRTAGTGGVSLRSAMMTDDKYPPDERLRRRRSRSIAFREKEAEGHHVGDRYHQPPGAEAAAAGKYLKSYDGDEDRMDYAYSSRGGGGRERGVERYDYERRDVERDDRGRGYAPQEVRGAVGGRSRSRRRRGERSDSYDSVYREETRKVSYY